MAPRTRVLAIGAVVLAITAVGAFGGAAWLATRPDEGTATTTSSSPPRASKTPPTPKVPRFWVEAQAAMKAAPDVIGEKLTSGWRVANAGVLDARRDRVTLLTFNKSRSQGRSTSRNVLVWDGDRWREDSHDRELPDGVPVTAELWAGERGKDALAVVDSCVRSGMRIGKLSPQEMAGFEKCTVGDLRRRLDNGTLQSAGSLVPGVSLTVERLTPALTSLEASRAKVLVVVKGTMGGGSSPHSYYLEVDLETDAKGIWRLSNYRQLV